MNYWRLNVKLMGQRLLIKLIKESKVENAYEIKSVIVLDRR